ncbi:virulence factor SrfC family protein [Acerihabitans sp. TG2]|uniref:virulence factor SrfC family protein n=1 Tax=Acerihabitans sp. TG2 TaxID=3096008 RepID=UPI002B226154|nr:virulence factor SrfC family protein [Acerihabitans sp. TG2]MEA9389321.1 virulence factor SrfC family protein [Acerihabitans sp. TG2]
MKSPSLASPSARQNQLLKPLRLMTQGIGQGIDWVENTRLEAPRLDIEAQGLCIKLRRARIHALAFSNATLAPLSLGFYGQSQPGKIHLISALAADENGAIKTALDVESTEVMPWMTGQLPGVVVTRFSRQAVTLDPDYPVHLQLLEEIEVAKILATVDLSRTGPGIALDRQVCDDRLDSLRLLRQSEPLAGISGDDMVALWDYLDRQGSQRQEPWFNDRFWPAAIDLAPFLLVDDRARLFSLLWGEDVELTTTYRQLAHTLHKLHGASSVQAPLKILSRDLVSNDELLVRPLLTKQKSQPVALSAALVWALAAELRVPLQGSCQRPKFEHIDLVDFPGDNLGGTDVHDGKPTPLSEKTLAQAKRAYLLARYTDRQELGLLMVCNAAGQKSAVKQVGRALAYWVQQTQGETLLSRKGHKPGLIWVLTPFDPQSSQARQHDAAVQRLVGSPGDAWGSMLTLDAGGLDRMADYVSVELSRATQCARLSDRFAELRRELTDNLLGRWYQSAEEADSAAKTRVAETLLKILQTRAGVHGELLEKLLPTRDNLRPLYLHSPDAPLYLQVQDPGAETSPLTDNSSFGVGLFIDLLDAQPTEVRQPTAARQTGSADAHYDYERAFARRVMHYWINHLRSLPDNGPLAALLGLTKAELEMLMEELITAAHRLDLSKILLRALTNDGAAMATDGKAESKADRQVAQVLTVLGDFIGWLGFQGKDTTQRPDSIVNPGHKIFERMTLAPQDWGSSQRLTRLSLAPVNTTAFYIYDWLVGLKALIIQNAGYTGAQDLSPAAQQALGKIMAHFPPITAKPASS